MRYKHVFAVCAYKDSPYPVSYTHLDVYKRQRLGRCIRDGRAPVEEIKAALQFLYDVAEDQIVPFAVTPEFTRTFGPVPDIDDVSYKVSNIDGLFENLMITQKDGDEKLYCLDYEWVFDFPVPARDVYKRQGLWLPGQG